MYTVVSTNGKYLPPSPPDQMNTFWKHRSHKSSSHSGSERRKLPADPLECSFTLPTDSLENYRRSFDMSFIDQGSNSAGLSVPPIQSVSAMQSSQLVDPAHSDQPAQPAQPAHSVHPATRAVPDPEPIHDDVNPSPITFRRRKFLWRRRHSMDNNNLNELSTIST